MAAIVSSTKPISLKLLCDDVSKMGAKSFEVSNFPTMINTSCEIQEIKKDTSLTRLPQLNKDFVQNQFNTEILTQTPNIVITRFSLATSRSNAYYYSIVHFHPHLSSYNICYCLDMLSE